MLKFVIVLRRKPDWTHEKFRDYFIGVHAPLAEKIPGLRRYKRNFPMADPKRRPPDWDCVVEMYFKDKDAMEEAWATPEGKAASADTELLADMSRSSWSVVNERVWFP
ncbi:MAG TPA: EthD domain-containing protein [Candidatus Limnocylindrales bacterium]|nr:EthD domain-containing protein [Candidatus Limnocylindrales bacterium]